MLYTASGGKIPVYLERTETVSTQLSADHSHLLEYLTNSLQYAPHPLPLGEKSDSEYSGIKISLHVYMETPNAYFCMISVGNNVNLYYGGFDNVNFEKILAAYNPDACGNDNVYQYGR